MACVAKNFKTNLWILHYFFSFCFWINCSFWLCLGLHLHCVHKVDLDHHTSMLFVFFVQLCIVLPRWGWRWSKHQASKHLCRNMLVMAQMLHPFFFSSGLINVSLVVHHALTSPHPLLFYTWCLFHSWRSLQGLLDFGTLYCLWPSLAGRPGSEEQEVISGITLSATISTDSSHVIASTAGRNSSKRGTDSWFDEAAPLNVEMCYEPHCW